ncbi:phosphonatase-like hydrolase [Nocardioides sp. InS609-2]|uniref:phosphonatase-like hydrolase n=1 Tax=Nocardioides sp. InS609-2 TaxID=2760705 RepID=UPI001808BA90|nr:phosphonatase-like hydrolase [Nocardioides sp. InS609-2]MBA3781926.1 phosphonatase-like hydrolase [Nocardioides sp.]
MIELAVLDMAGTTIDDGGAVYVALRECVEAHGVTVTDERLQAWMGTDKRTAIDALLGDLATPDLVEKTYADFSSRLETSYLARPPTPIPGVPEALAELRASGVKVVLTTGFAHDVADPLLAAIGWTPGLAGAPVDALVCADDVAAGRPAPYMIFRAMELAGVLSPTRVAVAGDTHVDVLAGSNAGAAIVAGVLTGALPAEVLGTARHTHLLASVADLPALIRQT